MANADNFFTAIEDRISCYSLTNKSPISDARIHKIIDDTVKHTPSAFNVQSTRAVVLVKQDHEKLWDIGDAQLKKAMPEAAYAALAPKVQGFKAAYGTVLWFEDQAALDTLKSKNPGIQHVVTDCEYRSSQVAISAD